MPPAQLNWEHYQKFFNSKQRTFGEAISFGVHRALDASHNSDAAKTLIVKILKFIIEKFEENPDKISRVISYRATKAQAQLEADIFMGISTSLDVYGSIGSDADADKMGLFLWVFKRLVTALEAGTLDGTEGVEEIPPAVEEASTES